MHMKYLHTLLSLAIIAFALPACSTPKKKECDMKTSSCCAAKGKCDDSMKKHKH